MIPTITDQIRTSIVRDYLSYALVAFLIYRPELGPDDNPTNTEYTSRTALTMSEVVEYEIGGYELNGYSRVYIEEPDIVSEGPVVRLRAQAQFQAVGGNIGPFTHVCLARGANIFSLSPSNGNNRGDSQGQLILTMPSTSRDLGGGIRGLILEPPELYRVTIPINLTKYLV